MRAIQTKGAAQKEAAGHQATFQTTGRHRVASFRSIGRSMDHSQDLIIRKTLLKPPKVVVPDDFPPLACELKELCRVRLVGHSS